MPELVVVTGGTGYVAGWLIVGLLRRGYAVRTTIRAASREAAVRESIGSEVDAGGRLSFALADLLDDAGWDAAMDGADYVLHAASPLGNEHSENADELIIPARDGTLRVLRAARDAGVKRVVMTSAANAASPASYTTAGVTDESLWTLDDPSMPAYRRSKTLAERAAWDFIAAGTGAMTLTTVLPGAVFGPVLSAGNIGSTRIIARMLSGGMRGLPRIGLEVVDVRDLADLHIRAMESPQAAGERFLGTGEFAWMREIAEALRTELGEQAAKVPTRQLPDLMVRAAARSDPSLRAIAISLGRQNRHSTAKAQQVLGWSARPASETVVACARSLIAHGVV